MNNKDHIEHVRKIDSAFEYFMEEYRDNYRLKRWVDDFCTLNEATLWACFEELVNIEGPYDEMVEDIDTFVGNFYHMYQFIFCEDE